MANNPLSRRKFIQLGTGVVAASAVATNILQPHLLYASPRRVAPSDTVRFASIGTGIRGCEHLEASLSVPGIQCVAVCDLYDSRHTAAQEAVKNPSVPATRDYRSILDRKDVDSVLIATMDHQHRHIFEDACAAGKDIYCEKPMSHTRRRRFRHDGSRAEAQPHGCRRQPACQLDSLCEGEGDFRFRQTRRSLLHQRLLGSQFAQRRMGLSHPAGCQRENDRLEYFPRKRSKARLRPDPLLPLALFH